MNRKLLERRQKAKRTVKLKKANLVKYVMPSSVGFWVDQGWKEVKAKKKATKED